MSNELAAVVTTYEVELVGAGRMSRDDGPLDEREASDRSQGLQTTSRREPGSCPTGEHQALHDGTAQRQWRARAITFVGLHTRASPMRPVISKRPRRPCFSDRAILPGGPGERFTSTLTWRRRDARRPARARTTARRVGRGFGRSLVYGNRAYRHENGRLCR